MDVNTTDPYEQKLYNMFKSFDVQSMGTLDKNALLDLCTTLELKDRSAKLVANLIDPKQNNRVSFNEFKEGLLNLLGTDTDVEESNTNGKRYRFHAISLSLSQFGDNRRKRFTLYHFINKFSVAYEQRTVHLAAKCHLQHIAII